MSGKVIQSQDKSSGFKPDYLILCYVGLFVILLALISRNFGTASIIPVLVGVIGLVFQWNSGPVLLLLSLVWVFLADSLGMTPMSFAAAIVSAVFGPLLGLHLNPQYRSFPRARPRDAVPFLDLILCLGVIAYCAGHYRLQSIMSLILPIDPRKKDPQSKEQLGFWLWRSRPQPVKEMRPKDLVGLKEMAGLILTIPVCAAVAELSWIVLMLSKGGRSLDMPGGLWRTILLTWIFGLGLLIAGFFINYFSLKKRLQSELLVANQDILWQETRIEQRRIARLLAWFRQKTASRRKKT
jgi:hypothetical protein